MNERDPISELETAIISRVGAWGMATVLLIIIGCLIAPVWGVLIQRKKMNDYALYSDCEQRAKAEMGPVWTILWIIAAMTWAFVIFCGERGYSAPWDSWPPGKIRRRWSILLAHRLIYTCLLLILNIYKFAEIEWPVLHRHFINGKILNLTEISKIKYQFVEMNFILLR